MMLSRQFQMYDYGRQMNQRKYGQDSAPVYDLGSIKDVPVALLCGSRDQLSSAPDYEWLRDQLH